MEADRIEYAGFGRRSAAFFIDAVIQFIVFLVWASVALVVLRPTPAQSIVILHGTDFPVFQLEVEEMREQLAGNSDNLKVIRIQIGGGLILLVLYTVGFRAWRGQTLGKIALRV